MADHNDLDAAIALFLQDYPVCVRPADLDAFLELTQGLDITAGQRLRRLAIALERRAVCRRWEDLHAIYQRAAELAPDDFTVFHSWGISARSWIESRWRPEPVADADIATEAERALLRAADLAPQSGIVAHSLGLLYYSHPLRKTDEPGYREKAMTCFRHAVEWGPDGYRAIAQLYLAHCHHDRKDWPAAIAAYEKVDRVVLAHEWPRWREVKCREQLAHCYAFSGQKEEAIRQFSHWLDDLEPLDDETLKDWGINLDELVEAVTVCLQEPILRERTQVLARRIGYEWRYPGLFVPGPCPGPDS